MLENDGNRQLVEVEQTAMCLFKTVRTRTFVYQVRARLRAQGACCHPAVIIRSHCRLTRSQARPVRCCPVQQQQSGC